MADPHAIKVLGGPGDGETLADVADRLSVDGYPYRLYRLERTDIEREIETIEWVLVAKDHPPPPGATATQRIWR